MQLWSRLSARNQELVIWVVAGLLALGAGLGGAYVYANYFGPKEIAYRVCFGQDANRCPKDTVFVHDIGIGQQPLVDWVGRQCAKFKRRQTIASEGPADCNCEIVQVTCSATL
jgi:hypothetical protein